MEYVCGPEFKSRLSLSPGVCVVQAPRHEEGDEPLPWCSMASETSHAIRLATIFELALLGWVLNVLANPIIYAFW